MSQTLRRALVALVSLAALAWAAEAFAFSFPWSGSSQDPRPILGVVRETEIQIAPETTGRLQSVFVTEGQAVHKGDVLAVISAPEISASVEEAKAASGKARANRDNVFSGVRKEEVDISAQNVDIAEANLKLAQQEYQRWSTLAAKSFASKQQLDESTDSLEKAQANLASLRAINAQDRAGPTAEERAIATAQVDLADASAASLEAKLAKTKLVAPVDGVVGLLVLTPGEILSPGQSIMTLEAKGGRWASFTIREDELNGLTIGSQVKLRTADGRSIPGRLTELRPLGEFATWRAARAVGDHDLNSFLVRVDPAAAPDGFEPGMTVWLEPA
jgi:HlyD family secretion protein